MTDLAPTVVFERRRVDDVDPKCRHLDTVSVGRGVPAATSAHTPRHARGSVEDEVAADAAASLSANLVIL
jgi:hypothetical protein